MSSGGGWGVRMVMVDEIVGGVIEVKNVEWAGKSRTKRQGASRSAEHSSQRGGPTFGIFDQI